MNIFKFNNNKEENTKEISLENSVFEVEGEQIPAETLLNAYKSMKEEEKKENKMKKLNGDDEVEVNGEMVKISDMAKAYKSMKKKENEEKEMKENEEKEEEEKKKEVKKNSVDLEEIKKSKEVFENGKASQGVEAYKVTTKQDCIEIGKAIFGSTQKIKKQ